MEKRLRKKDKKVIRIGLLVNNNESTVHYNQSCTSLFRPDAPQLKMRILILCVVRAT